MTRRWPPLPTRFPSVLLAKRLLTSAVRPVGCYPHCSKASRRQVVPRPLLRVVDPRRTHTRTVRNFSRECGPPDSFTKPISDSSDLPGRILLGSRCHKSPPGQVDYILVIASAFQNSKVGSPMPTSADCGPLVYPFTTVFRTRRECYPILTHGTTPRRHDGAQPKISTQHFAPYTATCSEGYCQIFRSVQPTSASSPYNGSSCFREPQPDLQ